MCPLFECIFFYLYVCICVLYPNPVPLHTNNQPPHPHHPTRTHQHQVPFGILVGGSEELLHMEYGKENVYILERKGFIKYALQHGWVGETMRAQCVSAYGYLVGYPVCSPGAFFVALT